MIKIALNGSWLKEEKPYVPVTTEEYLKDIKWFMDRGIRHFHIHFRDENGHDSLDMKAIRPQFEALKKAFPDCLIGVGSPLGEDRTSALRLRQVKDWTDWKPDYISVNICEEGRAEFVELLREKGVPIEFGIFDMEDAKTYVKERYNDIALRVLIEVPCAGSAEATLSNAREIYEYLSGLYPETEYVIHGEEVHTWNVISYAMKQGQSWRIGLEDVDQDPSGKMMTDNTQLYLKALEYYNDSGR